MFLFCVSVFAYRMKKTHTCAALRKLILKVFFWLYLHLISLPHQVSAWFLRLLLSPPMLRAPDPLLSSKLESRKIIIIDYFVKKYPLNSSSFRNNRCTKFEFYIYSHTYDFGVNILRSLATAVKNNCQGFCETTVTDTTLKILIYPLGTESKP